MDSKVLCKDKEWLIARYVNERLSVHAIADLCGVTIPTIAHWLRKFGIRHYSSSGGGNSG